jgi:hypothetical protein
LTIYKIVQDDVTLKEINIKSWNITTDIWMKDRSRIFSILMDVLEADALFEKHNISELQTILLKLKLYDY